MPGQTAWKDPVRVRCGRIWHEVAIGPWGLVVPHPAEELRREATIAALGAQPSGCFRAHEAWRTGRFPLPRRLRDHRRELFQLAGEGSDDELLDLIRAGFGPHAVTDGGRSLLFFAGKLRLDTVRELIALGAPLDQRDTRGLSAAQQAMADGSPEAALLLITAGARPTTVTDWLQPSAPPADWPVIAGYQVLPDSPRPAAILQEWLRRRGMDWPAIPSQHVLTRLDAARSPDRAWTAEVTLMVAPQVLMRLGLHPDQPTSRVEGL